MTEKTIVLPSGGGTNGAGPNYRLTVLAPKRRYLSYLRERWWVPVLCMTLTIGAAVTCETLRTEDYTSYAMLYLAGDTQINNVTSLLNEESLTYFGTQIELLKSPRLQRAAMDKAGIQAEPGKKPPIAFDVVQPLKTSILKLQATGLDPEKTRLYLDGLIDEYLAYKKETREATSSDIVMSLTGELAKREKALKEEQDNWATFQKTNNVAVLEEEGKSAGLYLADLNLQLAKFRLEHELAKSGLSMLDNVATNLPADAASPTNSRASSAANDLALKSARLDLAMARAEKEKAPLGQMRFFDENIARLEKTVAILEDEDLLEKQLDVQSLEMRISAIKEAIPAWETNVLNINERLSEGDRIKNNMQREQGYYDHLLSTLQNVDLSRDVQQERLSVLEPASPAQTTKRYLAARVCLAAFGGGFLAAGIVFCWYLLDERFVSVRDVKDQFGEKILGLVPHVKVPRSQPAAALLQVEDKRRAYVESYRHLRSALLLSGAAAARPQVLLVTSAGPNEGKTTIAANLASVLASGGKRVVLVDTDVRGAAAQGSSKTQEATGILDFLRGGVDLHAILQPDKFPCLSRVEVGQIRENTEGLFLGPRLGQLVAELRASHDFVILDGGPILAVDDVAQLVPEADSVLLVVRPFSSRSSLVRLALDMLYQRQAKQVNIVFNRARPDDLAGHYARNGLNRVKRNGA
jgi:capsular exopolysaccharide synthesis family protein